MTLPGLALASWQPYVYGLPWYEIQTQTPPIWSVQARDRDVFMGGHFLFAGEWQRDRLVHLEPADTGPPVVGLLSPAGGEVLTVGSLRAVRWLAQDDRGIASADVYLSRSGPTGSWELLAAGITGTDTWTWTVAGQAAAGTCWLRVVARDWSGNTGEALSAGAVGIVEAPTPTLVELFRATQVAVGVLVEWRLATDGATNVTVERGASPTGGWSEIGGATRTENGLCSLTDTDAAASSRTWYRLAIATPGATTIHTQAVEATGASHVTEFAMGLPAPNPAAGVALFSYALPRRGPLRISVLDVQGRERSVLASGTHEAGLFTAALDSRDLPPGLYFIRLQAQGTERRRRIVVMR